jgi:hypothetical protein
MMSMELMNRLNAHTSKMMRPTTGFSRKIYRRLRAISFCATRQMLPPSPREACGMRMNVSITAENTKHAQLTYKIGRKPFQL